MANTIELMNAYSAHNYAPLPVVLVRGQGVRVWDDNDREYLDMLGAYSAVSFGHCHPRLVGALSRQAVALDTTSRAFYNDQLGLFLKRACELTGFDAALPMNSGAEAVETALKAARKWGYTVKGIAHDQAEIISCSGNFHGRTIAATGMSSVPQYRQNFGPFPPGFVSIPFGRATALANAVRPTTAAFLVEPIQGEGGIIVPPAGYLAECAKICRENNVLLICDEVQTGLGRTGKLLASEHDAVKPDVVTLGKALGGGLLPVSLVLARRDVMDVFRPGDHGSTFGGNALAAAVGREALDLLVEERLVEASAMKGAYLLRALHSIDSPLIREVRGKGLLVGLELRTERVSAREFCERLMQHGVLTKDTFHNVVRFAPPLTVTIEEIDIVVDKVKTCLIELNENGVQEASEESFPASDPPAHSAISHLGGPDRTGR